jgi:hypothetical protein
LKNNKRHEEEEEEEESEQRIARIAELDRFRREQEKEKTTRRHEWELSCQHVDSTGGGLIRPGSIAAGGRSLGALFVDLVD